MSDPDHIPLDDLVELVLGWLPADTRSRATLHLATGCTACQEDLAFLMRVMRGLRPTSPLVVSEPSEHGGDGLNKQLVFPGLPAEWAPSGVLRGLP